MKPNYFVLNFLVTHVLALVHFTVVTLRHLHKYMNLAALEDADCLNRPDEMLLLVPLPTPGLHEALFMC